MMYLVLHDALEVEADAVGRGIFEREYRLGGRGHDAGAEDAQSLGRLHEPELDRVPVEPGQIVQLAAL